MSNFYYSSDISTSVIVIVQFLFYVISEKFFSKNKDPEIRELTVTKYSLPENPRLKTFFCHKCFQLQVFYQKPPVPAPVQPQSKYLDYILHFVSLSLTHVPCK